ncbi:MAG: hypothetical protein LBD08_00190, partial [Treponema sp.]|nr:hypothetical protein [Treponema sp.]
MNTRSQRHTKGCFLFLLGTALLAGCNLDTGEIHHTKNTAVLGTWWWDTGADGEDRYLDFSARNCVTEIYYKSLFKLWIFAVNRPQKSRFSGSANLRFDGACKVEFWRL